MKLHTKIALALIGLTLATVVIASLLTSLQIKGYLDRHQAADLRAMLTTLTVVVNEGFVRVDSSLSHSSSLKMVAVESGTRITLIRKDGVVLFDSDVDPDSLHQMENHGSRPEVVQARRGPVGMEKRYSVTKGEEFLYAADMITNPAAGKLDSGFVRLARPTRDMDAVDAGVQRVVWAIGLSTIVVILLISYQMSRWITRPIQDIAATAEAITSGEVHQRVTVRTRDEIGALGNAINAMAEKLGSDIDQLRRLERVRSEFLGNVSHELRTPIFSIQGFIETLLDGAVDDPNVNREFLEKAHRHTVRLNTLLSDLIEISRIESGEMKMSFRYFPVGDFLRQVVDEMRPHAEKKQLLLSLSADTPADETVLGDRERLKQVMVNLVDNAIKYTEPGGSITVRTRRADDRCVVSVEDSGTGIPASHLPRIFERFYRVDRDRSREVGGTGLGLAIVKHIVDAHGSVVTVESEVGKGSVFSFGLKR